MFRVNQNGEPRRNKSISNRSVSTPAHNVPRNMWRLVKARRPDVIEYGRKEGILDKRRVNKGTIIAQNADRSSSDGVQDIKHEKIILQLGSSTEQFIEAAIPFIPVPCAIVCLLCNIFIPGLGTIISGVTVICFGQTNLRNYAAENRKGLTFIANIFVGICQFFTIPFFLVGWFWSIAWGGKLMIHAIEYRKAMEERRKELVTKATLEAINEDIGINKPTKKENVQNENNNVKNEDILIITSNVMITEPKPIFKIVNTIQ